MAEDTCTGAETDGIDEAQHAKLLRKQRPICMKCKVKPAEVAARQREPLCRSCLCDGLVSKVRGGVRGSNSVVANDSVLTCLSGGAASQAMLYFLKQMHNRDRDRLERGQVMFELKAIHIIEAGVVSNAASSTAHSAPKQLVESCSKADVPLYVVPMEAVFLPTEQSIPLSTVASCHCLPDLQQKLQGLLQAVADITGREDLIASLRKALLLRIAAQLGCNKVALGTSATRMAVRTVAMSAKGNGYALPGAIQFTDSRHGPKAATIIQPVREVGMRELAMLCHYKGLPVAAPLYSPATSKASLNTLSEDFVARLQANVPSSVSTILRTACKLQAFPWNEQHAARGRDAVHAEAALDPLCPICSCPLANAEVQDACQAAACQVDTDGVQQSILSISCCHSCRSQILPAKVAGKAGTLAKQVNSGGLLDPALMPPHIQKHAQRNLTALRATAQDMMPGQQDDDGDDVSQARKVMSTDSLRTQIASYLLD